MAQRLWMLLQHPEYDLRALLKETSVAPRKLHAWGNQRKCLCNHTTCNGTTERGKKATSGISSEAFCLKGDQETGGKTQSKTAPWQQRRVFRAARVICMDFIHLSIILIIKDIISAFSKRAKMHSSLHQLIAFWSNSTVSSQDTPLLPASALSCPAS